VVEAPPQGRLHKRMERVLSTIGRQEWLDRPSYRLEHLVAIAFNSLGSSRDRIANVLNGVWLGHPVHPPLASLTSGAIGTTVGLDALSLIPRRPKQELADASRFATRALGLGILANLCSAVTGVADWQHTHEEDRRIGLVHGALNGLATGLYIMSWLDRRRGRHGRGIVTTALGYGITASASYLGGALVFASGIGIDQSGARLRSPDWRPVLRVESLINGKPQRVEVDGVGLVLCRTGNNGEIAAFGEFCPHLAAPMSDGWVDRGRLVCPWHGSRFDVCSGAVVRGPSAAPLPRYQTRINDGMIELRGDGQHSLPAGKGVAK
jgi:nitrite reductase/ring-hydroxylating ferredoxin subunit